MRDVWQAADEIDTFTRCWDFDHFYPLVGDQNGTCMEAWVTLTVLATNTKRVRIEGGPPMVIGGGGEKRTLRIVAKYADPWNLPFAESEQFRAKHKC